MGFSYDFEKLDVYQLALQLYGEVLRLSKNFPREIQYSLGEQFRRAILSISNNIAEGSEKESRKEKIYFFSTSLHSIRECIPMITILYRERIIDEQKYYYLRNTSRRISSMLIKLINKVRNETKQ